MLDVHGRPNTVTQLWGGPFEKQDCLTSLLLDHRVVMSKGALESSFSTVKTASVCQISISSNN